MLRNSRIIRRRIAGEAEVQKLKELGATTMLTTKAITKETRDTRIGDLIQVEWAIVASIQV
jgi:hypothetical protein